MMYDISAMRAILQEQITPEYRSRATAGPIDESFKNMRASDDKLAGRSPFRCLIPQTNGENKAFTECNRATTSCHTIQKKALRIIADNEKGKLVVLEFMNINTARIATQGQGANGVLWQEKMPWDIETICPITVPITIASARHFACNVCDNATFRPIEDMEIAWPSQPEIIVIEDTETLQNQIAFSNQLFLMAYRCLLQKFSQFRGLVAGNEFAAKNQRISNVYRSTLEDWKPEIQHAHKKLSYWKRKYDRRLKDIAALPMKHWIVPVKPAFPMASTDLSPAASGHIATTVYPKERELPDGTIKVQHWMVITTEVEHVRTLDPVAEAMAVAAFQTLMNDQASIEWTVRRVTEDGGLGTYANPRHYSMFRKQHPLASQRIERHIPDTVVVEHYERNIGPALHCDT